MCNQRRKLPLLIGTAILVSAMNTIAAEEGMEEVVVTGTKIRGAEVIGSATQTLNEEAIESSAKLSLGDLMRDLPVNFAGGVGISDEVQGSQDAGPASANLGGGQGINLRGLGSLSTLVLVNGRRVPASGQFGDFVDISTLPLAAVERIEILQDGASALYGSDAVGGVVNFVLRKKLDAPITRVQFGGTSDGGGEEVLLSQLFGTDWEGGNIIVGGEYHHRDNVLATDRDPYSGGSDFSDEGGVNWQRYSANYSPQANIFFGDMGGGVDSPVGATVPFGSNASLNNADLIPSTTGYGAVPTNVYEGLDLLPEVERISLFAMLNHDINDAVSIYGDVRYAERDSDYNLGYGFLIENSLPLGNQFYISNIDPALVNSDGSIPFGLVVDDRLETRTASVESFGINVGVQIDVFSDWLLDMAVSYGKEDQNRVRHQLANVSLGGQMNRVTCALTSPGSSNPECAALNLTPLNPFSTEPHPAVDELFGFEDLTFESDVTQFTANLDGTLFEMGGRPVKLATGFEYREEVISGDLAWNTGSLSVIGGPYTETSRDASAVFMELAVPVTETFDLSLAARYEDFSGTGDYNSTDPKLGFNWWATDKLKFKGSIGTAFHAPPMRFENDDPQPLPGGNAAFLLPVSYRGPCDSDIVEFNGIIGTPGTAGESCTFSLIINSGGAGPGVLEPEEAETWSLGFEFSNSWEQGFYAHINYFNISIEERIQRIQGGTFPGIVAELFATGTTPFISALDIRPSAAQAQALIDSAKFLGTFGPPLANSAADVQMIVNATQINIALLDTAGFDFDFRYNFQAMDADVSAFFYGTYLTEFDTTAAPGAPTVDQLGKYSSFGAPVELRSLAGVSVEKNNWQAALQMRYTDSYTCAVGSCVVPDATGAPVSNSSSIGIDSWTTIDLNINVDLAKYGDMFEGVHMGLVVTNLFNEEPPFIDGGTSTADNIPSAYDPNNATIQNRTISLQFKKSWD